MITFGFWVQTRRRSPGPKFVLCLLLRPGRMWPQKAGRNRFSRCWRDLEKGDRLAGIVQDFAGQPFTVPGGGIRHKTFQVPPNNSTIAVVGETDRVRATPKSSGWNPGGSFSRLLCLQP